MFGIDTEGQILVADECKHKYKVLNTDTGQWTAVYTTDCTALDAKFVGKSIWLLGSCNDKHFIVKYDVHDLPPRRSNEVKVLKISDA